MDKVIAKRNEVEEIKTILKEIGIEPDEINGFFKEIDSAPITEKQKAEKILLRPSVDLNTLTAALPTLQNQLEGFSKETIEQASIQVKYDVYIEKEKELVSRMTQLEELEIPALLITKKFFHLVMKQGKS